MKKHLSLQDKAMLALKKAVSDVIKHHKKTGRPLFIWKDGRLVKIPPSRLRTGSGLPACRTGRNGNSETA